MNRIRAGVLVALLGLPLAAFAADSEPDRTGCDNVNWSAEVLAKFPNAKRGCQRVTVRSDTVLAQYNAEVVDVEKDGIVVHLKDRDDKDMTKVKIAPDTDEVIKVSGQDVKFWKVQKGTELHFYVPRDRWGLYTSPSGKPIKILSVQQL